MRSSNWARQRRGRRLVSLSRFRTKLSRAPTKALPLAELNEQIAALHAQAEALRKQEVAEVVARVKDAIAHYGLTANDLGLAAGGRNYAKLPVAGGGGSASSQGKKSGPNPSLRVSAEVNPPPFAGEVADLDTGVELR